MIDNLSEATQKWGPMAAIALFLVYSLTHDVSGSLTKLAERLEAHTSETAFYMRQMCVNTAQNEAQRAACIYR